MPFDFSQVFAGIARQGRSTVLHGLQWMLAILLLSLIWVHKEAPDSWLVKGLFVVVCVVSLLVCIAYIYFALRNPDALRSEYFSLQKMQLLGDSEQGLAPRNPGISGGDAKSLQLPTLTATNNPEQTAE